MEELQKKLAFSCVSFAVTASVLIVTAKLWQRDLFSVLLWAARTDFGVARLLRTDTRILLLLVGFLALLLAMLLSAVRSLRLMSRMVRLAARQPASSTRGAAPGSGAQTDRDKYVRQLDDQLKSGLIDRAEYKTLREKYERMSSEAPNER